MNNELYALRSRNDKKTFKISLQYVQKSTEKLKVNINKYHFKDKEESRMSPAIKFHNLMKFES